MTTTHFTQRLGPSQNVLTSHGFDAYGSNFISLSPPNDPYGYYGAQYGYYTDLETGLQLLTNRYYDASSGRFLTRDPIGTAGGQNLYEYTSGNPVGGADPSGLDGYWADVWRTLKAEGRGALGSVAGIPGSIYRGIKRTFTPGDPAFLTPGFFVGFAEEGIENARGFWSTVGKARDGDIDAGGELVGGGLAALLMGTLPGATLPSGMTCAEWAAAPKTLSAGSWTFKTQYHSGDGFTWLRGERAGSTNSHEFRIDYGRLPDKPSIPAFLRGKNMLHYHRRPGINLHRPYESRHGGRRW